MRGPTQDPPGALRPVFHLCGHRGPAQVQVLLQHLLPELGHLGLAVFLLLPQPPLACQPLLLLVGALDQQGCGSTVSREREDAVAGDKAGHGMVRGRHWVQGMLHRLGCLQAHILQLLCGRKHCHCGRPAHPRSPLLKAHD